MPEILLPPRPALLVANLDRPEDLLVQLVLPLEAHILGALLKLHHMSLSVTINNPLLQLIVCHFHLRGPLPHSALKIEKNLQNYEEIITFELMIMLERQDWLWTLNLREIVT